MCFTLPVREKAGTVNHRGHMHGEVAARVSNILTVTLEASAGIYCSSVLNSSEYVSVSCELMWAFPCVVILHFSAFRLV